MDLTFSDVIIAIMLFSLFWGIVARICDKDFK